MKNKFSFAFIILGLIGALAFISCSNGVNGYKDFKFTLTGSQLEAMMNAGSERSIVTVDDYDFTLNVTLFINGVASEERTINANIKDVRKPGFEGINLSFSAVPVGAEVYIKVVMDYEGEQIQAESNKIKVRKGSNSLTVEIKGIKIIQYLDTDIVVFGKKADTSKDYIFQISDESQAPDLNENSPSFFQNNSWGQDFAFDSKGRILYCGYISKDVIWTNYLIFSKDITVDGAPLNLVFYTETDMNTDDYELGSCNINIDRKNDNLYIFEDWMFKADPDADDAYYLKKFPSFLKDFSKNGEEVWQLSPSFVKNCCERFAVYNDVLYLADTDYLYLIDLQKNTSSMIDESVAKKIPLNLYSKFNISKGKTETFPVEGETQTCDVTLYDTDITINDIAIIDGNIYLLVEQYNLKSSSGGSVSDGFTFDRGFVCRGCMVQVEPDTGAIKIVGWYDNQTIPMGKKYKTYGPLYLWKFDSSAGSYTKVKENEIVFKAKSEEGMFDTKYSAYNVMSSTEINNYFMVPQRIVAIKPKKLVVLDGGIFLYTDKDLFYYGNANRLVEVDLKNFAINGNKSISKELQNKNFCSDSIYIVSKIVLKNSSGISCRTVAAGASSEADADFYYLPDYTPVEKLNDEVLGLDHNGSFNNLMGEGISYSITQYPGD